MVTLQQINETNFLEVCALQVKDEQKNFVASPVGILARAYAYRTSRARAYAVCEDDEIVGAVLWCDLEEAPACYHLMELLIDQRHQQKGYARAALRIVLAKLQKERRFPMVELCVKKENTAAIRLYESQGFQNTGYVDPDTPDSLCMAYPLRERCTAEITIHETCEEDLEHIQRLWATPAVMQFVGFPNGLHKTMEHLSQEWLPWVIQKPNRCHYSIYAEEIGYCGESFYSVDETGLASMDIKLLPCAQGKGIAERALSDALARAFIDGKARAAWVDPDPANAKALVLYARLGFRAKQRPAHLSPYPNPYLELSREAWEARHAD